MEAKKPMPLFIFDFGVLQQVFEGDNSKKALDLIIKIKDLKKMGAPMVSVTTLSNFLRALYLAKKVDADKLKDVLDSLNVIPSTADFKNEKAVIEDTIKLANTLGEVVSKGPAG